MPRRSLELSPSDPATPKARTPRTKHLRPGNPNLSRIRKSPLQDRASIALGGMFGPDVREVAYCLLEGTKRGTINASMGKLVLERVLPSSRPIQLNLPQIDSGAALIEAEAKITAALNAGTICPGEARTLQVWAKHSWRSRRIGKASP